MLLDSSRTSRTSPHKAALHWLRDLAFALAIAAFFIVFLYQPVKVEGTSMLPGLVDQERIFINKFVYHFENISRGDIVVFHYPYDTSKSYIKRVVAVPGDTVRIDDGDLYVNNERVLETYVPLEYRDDRSYGEITVGPNTYFVLGDHRSLSRDSREFGPIDSSYIYGKGVFSYWPLAKAGLLR
ncbi:MAG: signal peptidase I [Acidobacteriales bacterium]|nr:signal peptidase I [Terriglobales bacterium]